MSSVFGPLFSSSDLEEATVVALKKWFPRYLREYERQHNFTTEVFETPKNYTTRNEFDSDAGEPLPKIVVLSPGIIGNPRKKGDGKYSATWRLGIGIADAASTEEDAKRKIDGYGAVARSIMLNNSSLDTIGAVDIVWVDESTVDINIPGLIQQYKAVSIWFDVDIDGVAIKQAGPTDPDDGGHDYGQVQRVYVDLEKVVITDEV